MLKSRRDQGGTTMMEVLVSIVIVVVGLLGLAGLQSRAAVAEMESFQRSQALVLLQDMSDRVNASRRKWTSYAGPLAVTELGTGFGSVKDCSSTTSIPERDLCEWHNALLGAAESSGGLKVGAMIGARGCITNVNPVMPREFQIAVVWQGLVPTASPTSTDCGKDQYGDDATRRVVVTNLVVGCLQNNLTTGQCVTP